jgi:FAD/FMN-containing dehydrogenase
MLMNINRSTACYLNPAVITTPRTSGEVSAVLRLITFLGTSFSVRGGGHLQNPGFQSNNDGVVIALQEFRQLELSADEKTADVGVGLRWLEVYKRLDPFGLAVTGGRVPDVGVPGLVLGGGLSFQNGERGLACMGVTEYEVCSYRHGLES